MNWLFLVHQVYTPSSKERVKVWRAIKKIGAVLYRNSVYVLPYSKERMEDFQWVCQQINDAQGEASVFVSRASGANEDQTLRALFKKAREEDYAKLQTAAEKLRRRIELARKGKRLTERFQKALEKEAKQLRETFEESKKIDFFSSSPPRKITQLIEEISGYLALSAQIPAAPLPKYSVKDFRKKVWTTREGIHIDRLCSAWLIRRFIDPEARFVFAPEGSLPKSAIPFDVFGAEFSHRGEDCTFETLVKAFRLRDSGLRPIAEMIHDVDLKDHKFGRSEASGIDVVIRSMADSLKDDHRLLEAGSAILDALYRFYSK
jgi:hypothetical protein